MNEAQRKALTDLSAAVKLVGECDKNHDITQPDTWREALAWLACASKAMAREIEAASANDDNLRALAVEIHGSAHIGIPANAKVSRVPGGTWVDACVFIPE